MRGSDDLDNGIHIIQIDVTKTITACNRWISVILQNLKLYV